MKVPIHQLFKNFTIRNCLTEAHVEELVKQNRRDIKTIKLQRKRKKVHFGT